MIYDNSKNDNSNNSNSNHNNNSNNDNNNNNYYYLHLSHAIIIIIFISLHNIAALGCMPYLILHRSILQLISKKHVKNWILAHSSLVTKYILGMNGFLVRIERI